jgi:hypothetical protein
MMALDSCRIEDNRFSLLKLRMVLHVTARGDRGRRRCRSRLVIQEEEKKALEDADDSKRKCVEVAGGSEGRCGTPIQLLRLAP